MRTKPTFCLLSPLYPKLSTVCGLFYFDLVEKPLISYKNLKISENLGSEREQEACVLLESLLFLVDLHKRKGLINHCLDNGKND